MSLLESADWRKNEVARNRYENEQEKKRFKVARLSFTVADGDMQIIDILYHGDEESIEPYLLSQIPFQQRPHVRLSEYDLKRCSIRLITPEAEKKMLEVLADKFSVVDSIKAKIKGE